MTTTQTLSPASPSAEVELPAEPRGGLVRYLRHAVVLARRSLVKTWRTPEALIDVTVQPIIPPQLWPTTRADYSLSARISRATSPARVHRS